MSRPYTHAVDLLRNAGLRPTRQRLALARLLFDGRERHLSAEEVHAEAATSGVRVSLATVYNSLHQFTAAGLLREVVVDPGRSYFDTNADDHHHFYFLDTGQLEDIRSDDVSVAKLPSPPPGTEIARVDVVVRVARQKARNSF